MYGMIVYSTLCVVCDRPRTKNRSFWLKYDNRPKTDFCSLIDEFTTDNDGRPMEHDSFGGGESIGASGGPTRLVQGALLHAFFQHTQYTVYVYEHTQDIAYVSDWR